MYCKNKMAALITIGATLTLGFAHKADAMTIDLTYDDTSGIAVTNAEKTVFNSVVSEYDNLFTNPVTVNIDVEATNTGLGGSHSSISGYYSYSQVKNALIANDPGLTLPSTDPTTGLPDAGHYAMTTAEAKALGLLAPNTSLDGTYTFNSDLTSPPQTPSASYYKLFSDAEHEFSEIMGRIPGLAVNGYYTPYDLFRYSAPGVRSFSNNLSGDPVYFSTNNGNTTGLSVAAGTLKYFNSTVGADLDDWASASASEANAGSPDAFDAYGAPGDFTIPTVSNSPVDIEVMNAIGWTSAVAVPEPSSIFGLGTVAALGLIGGLKRKLSKK